MHYEGDMILPDGFSKVTTNNPAARWTNGVVPYVIEGSFSKKLVGDNMYFFLVIFIYF